MARKYIRMSIWKETHDAFKRRYDEFTGDLKNMGVKKRVPFTRFMNAVAKKRATSDNIGEMIR